MRLFVFCGSKGGAGRTTSSVVLAAGLVSIGHRPVHLQFGVSGVQPAVALAKAIPFLAAALPEARISQELIQDISEARPDCDTIVVDLPKPIDRKVRFHGVTTAVLIPMRRAPQEIELAVRDYRKFQLGPKYTNAQDEGSPAPPPAAWILPISWPRTLGKRGLAIRMAPFDEGVRSGPSSPSLLMPGIPEIPRKDLDDLINGTRFYCSATINEAAILLARAATTALPEQNT